MIATRNWVLGCGGETLQVSQIMITQGGRCCCDKGFHFVSFFCCKKKVQDPSDAPRRRLEYDHVQPTRDDGGL